MDYVRLEENVVIERFTLPDDADITELFHPQVHILPAGDAEPGWLLEKGALVPPPPEEVTTDDLISYAASVRYEHEVGGITVGGMKVDTSRESQAMISGAHSFAQLNPNSEIRYKGANGFVTLTASQVTAIATTVAMHVQACFAMEAQADAAIRAGTITSYAEIEALSWPGAADGNAHS